MVGERTVSKLKTMKETNKIFSKRQDRYDEYLVWCKEHNAQVDSLNAVAFIESALRKELKDSAREWTERPVMFLCNEAVGIEAGKVMGIQNAFIKHFFNLEDDK